MCPSTMAARWRPLPLRPCRSWTPRALVDSPARERRPVCGGHLAAGQQVARRCSDVCGDALFRDGHPDNASLAADRSLDSEFRVCVARLCWFVSRPESAGHVPHDGSRHLGAGPALQPRRAVASTLFPPLGPTARTREVHRSSLATLRSGQVVIRSANPGRQNRVQSDRRTPVVRDDGRSALPTAESILPHERSPSIGLRGQRQPKGPSELGAAGSVRSSHGVRVTSFSMSRTRSRSRSRLAGAAPIVPSTSSSSRPLSPTLRPGAPIQPGMGGYARVSAI